MLVELEVQGLGVIERSQVDLSSGSTALTGETGAGKTLVVAALGLLRGGRAERSMVRQDAQRALVEGRFRIEVDSPTAQRLREMDLDADPEDDELEVILSRSIAPDGRAGKCRINGAMVSLADLASVGSSLLEIAGQNEHGRIAGRSVQRVILDSFAGASDLAADLASTVRAARSAEAEAERWRETERARAREFDILSFEVSEIEEAGVTIGEIENLTTEARRLENAEAIATALATVSELLRDEGGAEDKLGAAEAHLRVASTHDDSLASLTSRLGSIRLELTDIAGEISAARGPQDSEGLAQVQERLSVLAHLRRKFGDTESEILAHLAKARGRLDELRSAEDAATDFELKSKEAWGRAVEIAARLTASRRAATPLLIEAVQERLADLALGGALLEIELTPSPLSEHGAEEVSFLVSANPGERPKPIGKIASGGELSRISLALHLLLTQADAASTMVFDEVDAGVGGTAAQSIGRALAELGHRGGMQVLVVTHLPQVAAFTDNHLKVEKETLDGSTRARVVPVQGDERILELSRMLAGLPESELGQEHARELLAVAGSGTRKE